MLLDLNLRTSSAIFDLVGMFSKPKSVKGILGDATVSRNEKHWFYNCCCLVAKSCLTLWDPMDYSPLGSSVRGISQARILEWVTISSPGDLPNPGIKPASPALAGGFFTTEPPGNPTPPITAHPHGMSQFLKFNLSIYTHIDCIGFFPLENQLLPFPLCD